MELYDTYMTVENSRNWTLIDVVLVSILLTLNTFAPLPGVSIIDFENVFVYSAQFCSNLCRILKKLNKRKQ